MARRCEICGKGTVKGNKVSHAKNRTIRDWKPNIVRVTANLKGVKKAMRVCTRCLKAGKTVTV